MELPGDGGDVADERGGDVMLSVIQEVVGMGFLEGIGADASPERIVSPGFARVSVGRAAREPWARLEGTAVPVSLCSCRGKRLPASAWTIFSCTGIEVTSHLGK